MLVLRQRLLVSGAHLSRVGSSQYGDWRAQWVHAPGRWGALDADVVVTTVSARLLAAMLPDGALPSQPTKRLRSWRYGVGTFKVDFALEGLVPWTNADARHAGVVQLADTLDAAFRSQQQAGLGAVPDEPAMVIAQHSLHDASRAPDEGTRSTSTPMSRRVPSSPTM